MRNNKYKLINKRFLNLHRLYLRLCNKYDVDVEDRRKRKSKFKGFSCKVFIDSEFEDKFKQLLDDLEPYINRFTYNTSDKNLCKTMIHRNLLRFVEKFEEGKSKPMAGIRAICGNCKINIHKKNKVEFLEVNPAKHEVLLNKEEYEEPYEEVELHNQIKIFAKDLEDEDKFRYLSKKERNNLKEFRYIELEEDKKNMLLDDICINYFCIYEYLSLNIEDKYFKIRG